jgi:hypothetical protein
MTTLLSASSRPEPPVVTRTCYFRAETATPLLSSLNNRLMRPELFTIRRTGPGTLSTMARRGGDWLEDEMTGLSAAGVSVLVTLLSDAETSELGLSAEP